MEIIPVAGYSLEDKLPIAKRLDCKKCTKELFFLEHLVPGTFFHGKESNTG